MFKLTDDQVTQKSNQLVGDFFTSYCVSVCVCVCGACVCFALLEQYLVQ